MPYLSKLCLNECRPTHKLNDQDVLGSNFKSDSEEQASSSLTQLSV